MDLMGRARTLINSAYGVGKLEVYMAVALIYWGLTIGADMLVRFLEKRAPYAGRL